MYLSFLETKNSPSSDKLETTSPREWVLLKNSSWLNFPFDREVYDVIFHKIHIVKIDLIINFKNLLFCFFQFWYFSLFENVKLILIWLLQFCLEKFNF